MSTNIKDALITPSDARTISSTENKRVSPDLLTRLRDITEYIIAAGKMGDFTCDVDCLDTEVSGDRLTTRGNDLVEIMLNRDIGSGRHYGVSLRQVDGRHVFRIVW